MKIFFDLDGTLLDSSERLYNLFCKLVPSANFSKSEYWDLKRNKVNHETILNNYFPQYDFYSFNKKWLSLIESDKYLEFDKVYNGIYDMLSHLNSKNNELYLLTARQSKQQLFKELEKFNLTVFFKSVLVTENKKTKSELLNSTYLNKDDIFVSDMGKDILVANEAGIKSIAVTWGFMNKYNLQNYNPLYICDTIQDIENFILK